MASLKENIAYVSERLANSTIKVDELAKNVKVGDTYEWNGVYGKTTSIVASIRETKSRIFFTISENGRVNERRGIGHNSYFFF